MSILDRLKNSLHSKKAFTTAEMLLVLLIVSFLILAIPPIIHKKFVKQAKRGMHGRYECWRDANGNVYEFLATEKEGIKRGRRGNPANTDPYTGQPESRNAVFPQPVNDGVCRFNPKVDAVDAPYFSIQAIGGGAGGTYPPYEVPNSGEEFNNYVGHKVSQAKHILLNDENISQNLVVSKCMSQNPGSTNNQCMLNIGSRSSTYFDGHSASNKVSYEAALAYYDQFDDYKWVREFFPPVVNSKDIVICSGMGHRGLITDNTNHVGECASKHCIKYALGSKGGYGVCYKFPAGTLAIKGKENYIKISKSNLPRSYVMEHDHSRALYAKATFVPFNKDEPISYTESGYSLSQTNDFLSNVHNPIGSGNSHISCVEPIWQPCVKADSDFNDGVNPDSEGSRFHHSNTINPVNSADEPVISGYGYFDAHRNKVITYTDMLNSDKFIYPYNSDTTGFCTYTGRVYKILNKRKFCLVPTDTNDPDYEPGDSDENYTPDITIEVSPYKYKADGSGELVDPVVFTIYGGLPGAPADKLSHYPGLTYRDSIGEKDESKNGLNRMKVVKQGETVSEHNKCGHSDYFPDCVKPTSVTDTKWTGSQYPNYEEWGWRSSHSLHQIFVLLRKYYRQMFPTFWTSSTDYTSYGIALAYTRDFNTTTFGYAGETGAYISQILPRFIGKLQIIPGEAGTAGTKGNEEQRVGNNGSDTVIWSKKLSANDTRCMPNSSDCRITLLAKGGLPVSGGAIGKVLVMSGSETGMRDNEIRVNCSNNRIHGCLDGGAWNNSLRFAKSSGFIIIPELDKHTATISAIAHIPNYSPGQGGNGGYSFIPSNDGSEKLYNGIEHTGTTSGYMTASRHNNMSVASLRDSGAGTWIQSPSNQYTFTRTSLNTITHATLNSYRCYTGPREDDVGNPPLASDDIINHSKVVAKVCRPTNGQAGAVVIIW